MFKNALLYITAKKVMYNGILNLVTPDNEEDFWKEYHL